MWDFLKIKTNFCFYTLICFSIKNQIFVIFNKSDVFLLLLILNHLKTSVFKNVL